MAALAGAAHSQTHTATDLEKPFAVKSGEQILDVGQQGHSSPLFTDWDGDGLKDLLVGQYGKGATETEGAVRIYKNVGSAKLPRFDSFTYVVANGRTNLVPTG